MDSAGRRGSSVLTLTTSKGLHRTAHTADEVPAAKLLCHTVNSASEAFVIVPTRQKPQAEPPTSSQTIACRLSSDGHLGTIRLRRCVSQGQTACLRSCWWSSENSVLFDANVAADAFDKGGQGAGEGHATQAPSAWQATTTGVSFAQPTRKQRSDSGPYQACMQLPTASRSAELRQKSCVARMHHEQPFQANP